jgi:hypothetical protein
MAKKLNLEIILLDEADNVSNSTLEGDFLKYFQEGLPKMPWFKEVSKVSISA